mgnify:CR=1 FL=1
MCDAAWSAAADCGEMAFELQDPKRRPGYYNKTEASWGGNPLKGDDGRFHLVHAQMANSCPLGSWTTDSFVARSVADSMNGPYTFEEEMLVPFAHNPTTRRNPDGSYTIFFIGGWHTNVTNCSKADALHDAQCDGQNWPTTCGPNMPGPSGA